MVQGQTLAGQTLAVVQAPGRILSFLQWCADGESWRARRDQIKDLLNENPWHIDRQELNDEKAELKRLIAVRSIPIFFF